MQHLEGSGTPVLYIQDARFLKVKIQKPYILSINTVYDHVPSNSYNKSLIISFSIINQLNVYGPVHCNNILVYNSN